MSCTGWCPTEDNPKFKHESSATCTTYMTHLQTGDLACSPQVTLEYAKMCIIAALHLNSTHLTTNPRDSTDIAALQLSWTAANWRAIHI